MAFAADVDVWRSMSYRLKIIELFTNLVIESIWGLFFIVLATTGCDGKSSPAGGLDVIHPGVSGELCSTENSYRVTDTQSGETQEISFTSVPELSGFRGNMGGQIRAVTVLEAAGEEAGLDQLLVWGGGSSLRFGISSPVGAVTLAHRGVVTDLTTAGSGDASQVIFGTSQGLGLVELVEGGQLVEVPESYRPFPSGILAVDVSVQETSTDIYFITAEGYLLKTTATDLKGTGNCFSLVTSKAAMTAADTTFRYRPRDLKVHEGRAYVIADRRAKDTDFAPTFPQVFAPFCQSLIESNRAAILRAVDLESHAVGEVAFEATDESFSGYDQFIPTDVAFHGEELFVAGVGYDQAAVDSFALAECADGDLAARVACMCEGLADGRLTALTTSDGRSAFVGGFFIYRNLSDLSKANHFEAIPLTTSRHHHDATPFVFRLVAEENEVTLRAPNFVVTMTKGVSSITEEEEWSFSQRFDSDAGLLPGMPTDLISVSQNGVRGVAAAVVAAQDDVGTGGSALEVAASDGSFSVLDTGALSTRIEGAGGGYVAAIELIDDVGGVLLLQNGAERYRMGVTAMGGAFVRRADYNGARLAFAWTEEVTDSRPWPQWRLAVQNGVDVATRGELVISRQGGSGQFDGFPDLVGLSNSEVEQARSIGDVKLSGSYLFVLFEGFYDETWFHQVGVYSYGATNTPVLVGLTNTLSSAGGAGLGGGALENITRSGSQHTVILSTATGLHRFTITPGTAANRSSANIESVTAASDVMTATCDAGSSALCAMLSGSSVTLQGLSDASARATVTIAGDGIFAGADLALLGSRFYFVGPKNAEKKFIVFDIANVSQPSEIASCATCDFNGVGMFSALPEYLFVSSETGGVEIYDPNSFSTSSE